MLYNRCDDGVQFTAPTLFNLSSRGVQLSAPYSDELLFHIFHCQQDSLDIISRLKVCCDTPEWENHREQIFSASSCLSIRHKLMVSEGLTERLLQEVAASTSPFLLDQYERLLKKQFPERVRDAYIDYIIRNAKNTSDRKQYRHLIHYLKKLQQYPNGAAAAAEISANWRVQYTRRSAMMDELKQAGF